MANPKKNNNNEIVRTVAEMTTLALNIQYIQKDILEIKQSIKEIGGTFVTVSDFAIHLKRDEDHENRIRLIEQSMWKWVGIASAAGAIVSIVITIVLKFIKV